MKHIVRLTRVVFVPIQRHKSEEELLTIAMRFSTGIRSIY